MVVGSLFTGIGGFDHAFENLGCSIAWANDIDKHACNTYRANFSTPIICSDICNVNLSHLCKVDIITAGFPCQAFSILGKREGFAHEKGRGFFDVIRVTRELQPKCLFLENVRHLVSHDNGNTFNNVILKSLRDIGYSHFHHKIINTCTYTGIPQNRVRVYIVAFRSPPELPFKFKEQSFIPKHIYSVLDKDEPANLKYIERYHGAVLRDTSYQLKRRNNLYENKSKLYPTLTTRVSSLPVINYKGLIRRITPRECARLQGYPDTFVLPTNVSLNQQYKQLGNSVTVPVVQSIASQILQSLQGTTKSSLV